MTKTILIVGALVLAAIVLVPVAILVGSDMRDHKLASEFADNQAPIAKVPLSVAEVRARLDLKLNGGVKMDYQRRNGRRLTLRKTENCCLTTALIFCVSKLQNPTKPKSPFWVTTPT